MIYQGREYNLARPFARVSMADAILDANDGIDAARCATWTTCAAGARRSARSSTRAMAPASCRCAIFDHTVEHTLLDPTFIYAYPAEVSPLSRANDADPFLTDRFEFFMSAAASSPMASRS